MRGEFLANSVPETDKVFAPEATWILIRLV